jgi:ElaB/YqjD/DUF883 family membrane-anchored ribosome-binding protein
MAEEPDVIRHQIDETRESLTEKLESLEGQVKDAVGAVTDTIETVKSTVENTVESVKSGVEDTVESVKTSLSDTVDSVKETFDLGRQIDRHPWAAVGCTLAAGVAAGYFLLGRRRAYYPEGIPGMNHLIPGYRPERPAAASYAATPPEPPQPGFLEGLLSSFEGELGKVKQTAIGALVGMARDAIKGALPPSLSDSVSEIMDNVTRHAGGEPVRGPVLEPEHAGRG